MESGSLIPEHVLLTTSHSANPLPQAAVGGKESSSFTDLKNLPFLLSCVLQTYSPTFLLAYQFCQSGFFDLQDFNIFTLYGFCLWSHALKDLLHSK